MDEKRKDGAKAPVPGNPEWSRIASGPEQLNDRIARFQLILCILVMFVHFYNLDIFPDNPIPFVEFLQNTEVKMLGTTAVAGFFLLSGYRFSQGLSVQTLAGKLKRRLFSLLIPYLVWNLIYSLYAFLMANHPFLNRFADAKEVSVAELLWGILDSARYNPVFWYMKYLMIMILLASGLILLFRKRAVFPAFLPIVICGAFVGARIPGFPEKVYSFLLWSFFFLFGISLQHFGEEEPRGPVGEMFTSLGRSLRETDSNGIFLSILFFCLFYVAYDFFSSPFIFLGYHLSYISFLWSLTSLLKSGKAPKLSSATFFLYASHWLIARNVNKLFCVTFNTTSMLPGFVCYLMLPIIVLLIGALCRKLGETKAFRPVWRILNGGR